MRLPAFAMSFAALSVWTSLALAQLGGGRGSSGSPPAPEDPGKLIAFELILIERGPEQLAGESGKQLTADQILELEKKGKLGSVQRLKLVALENTEARLTLGESAPVVTSRSLRGGGGQGGFAGSGFPGSESVTYMDLGTTVLITAKVEKSGSVVASLNVQRTSFAPQKAPEKVEGQDAPPPVQPRRLTSTISTAARIASGETAVLCGQQTLTGSNPSELWVLVTAKVQ